MKLKRLGRTGLKVSEICLGTMTFGAQADESSSFDILNRSADAGVNFIDTADIYPVPVSPETAGRTEEIVGKWLKGRRERFILATKCRAKMGDNPWDEGLSRKHILHAVEQSLRRLGTDYIDLYQTHGPDAETPIEETLTALNDLVRSGKVRYIGCSNYSARLLLKSLWMSDKYMLSRYDCVQPRYNLLFRQIEDELLPLCREEGVGVIVYNPLAGGFLTGKHRLETPVEGSRFDIMPSGSIYHNRYWKQEAFEAVSLLQDFFVSRNKSLAQAAIAWTLHQNGITSAILGASRVEQLDQTLSAVDMELDSEELEMCSDIWFRLPRERDPVLALR